MSDDNGGLSYEEARDLATALSGTAWGAVQQRLYELLGNTPLAKRFKPGLFSDVAQLFGAVQDAAVDRNVVFEAIVKAIVYPNAHLPERYSTLTVMGER